MLGAVKPIRARLRVVASGVDWFSVSAEWEAEGLTLTDEDLAALRGATGPYVKISSGWVRREAGDALDDTVETLAEIGIEPGGGEQRIGVWQLAQADPKSLAAFEQLGADPAAVAAIRTLREKVAEFAGLPRVAIPSGFQGELRPYQREGVDFLAYGTQLGLGAVLADDMGLGKTVQALVWLLWLRERTPDAGPALVVCPASVVHNWAREAEKFAPGLRVASAHQRRAAARAARGGREPRSARHQLRAAAARSRSVAQGAARGRDPGRGAEHQEPGRGRQSARRSRSTRAIGWRSPARRSRTARSTCGASWRS
jgi:hypothetical protein